MSTFVYNNALEYYIFSVPFLYHHLLANCVLINPDLIGSFRLKLATTSLSLDQILAMINQSLFAIIFVPPFSMQFSSSVKSFKPHFRQMILHALLSDYDYSLKVTKLIMVEYKLILVVVDVDLNE